MSRLIDNIKTGRDDPSLNLQIALMSHWTHTVPLTGIRLERDIWMTLPWSGWQGLFNKDGLRLVRNCLMMSKITFHTDLHYTLWMALYSYMTELSFPIGLRQIFLSKIHDAHLGIVKSKLLGRTLFFWPNWNAYVKRVCQTCDLCRQNKMMPAIHTQVPS